MEAYDKNCWRTPDSLFQPLHQEFGFVLDAAASVGAEKCPLFIPPELDSLTTPWVDVAPAGSQVWINPPFNPMQPWADKVLQEYWSGMNVVMVANAATGTKWFRQLAEASSQIRFTTGRVSFLHPNTGEPVGGNNMAQAIFVLQHDRTYDERVIWFNV